MDSSAASSTGPVAPERGRSATRGHADGRPAPAARRAAAGRHETRRHPDPAPTSQRQPQRPCGVATVNDVAPSFVPLTTASTDSEPASTVCARVEKVVDMVLPAATVIFLLP